MNITGVNDLAAYIKRERLQRGWTQEQLARRSGVSREWLIGLEKGKSSVELGLTFRTLKALGLQLAIEETPKPTSLTSRYLQNLSNPSMHKDDE